MSAVLAATLPVFAIIALGFSLVRFQLLPKEAARALGAFVLIVALPALIFTALAKRNFAEIFEPNFLLAFAAGTFATAALVLLIARFALNRGLTEAAIMALGAAGANSGFVGYPIAAAVVGPQAAVALALCMLVENMLTIPLLLALAEAGAGGGRGAGVAIRQSLAGLVKNPLVLAIAAGLAASLTGFRLPAPLERSVDLLAAASAPVALVSIGGALAGLTIRRGLGGMALVVFGKLVLHPALVLAALLALPPVAADLKRALLIIAASPMMAIYPLIGARFGLAGPAAAALLVATILAFGTMSVLIGWL
jgi:predicted permease